MYNIRASLSIDTFSEMALDITTAEVKLISPMSPWTPPSAVLGFLNVPENQYKLGAQQSVIQNCHKGHHIQYNLQHPQLKLSQASSYNDVTKR